MAPPSTNQSSKAEEEAKQNRIHNQSIRKNRRDNRWAKRASGQLVETRGRGASLEAKIQAIPGAFLDDEETENIEDHTETESDASEEEVCKTIGTETLKNFGSLKVRDMHGMSTSFSHKIMIILCYSQAISKANLIFRFAK